MKYCHYSIVLTCIVFLFAAGCKEQTEGDKSTITEEQQADDAKGKQFTVDTAASFIRFTGYGVGKEHPGKFKLSSGYATVANNQVRGGEFVINIQSLDLEEKGGPFQKKLHPHLLSGDFFDAEKFRTAKFEVTTVEPFTAENSKDTSLVEGANYKVSGNLTLKDVTKNVTFPAKIDLDNNTLKAVADFDIDRTQWQINYGNDKTLGDKFISEKVNIEFDLKAHR